MSQMRNMRSALALYCVKCKVAIRLVKLNIHYPIEKFGRKWRVFAGSLYECPSCGYRLINLDTEMFIDQDAIINEYSKYIKE